MPDFKRPDDTPTQPLFGAQLVSYVLGELDAESQVAVETRVKAEPTLQDELYDIRAHLRIHQRQPKVAPRRGSFERLHSRMKRDGAFDGAIPGVHCMLRRAFILAIVVGAVAIALLIVFSGRGRGVVAPDVIGQVVYINPAERGNLARAEVDRTELVLNRDPPYDTGEYEAFIWLPTGLGGTSSTLETSPRTSFTFSHPRRIELQRGELRRADIHPGGVGEGTFIISTRHGEVRVQDGSVSVRVTPDGVQTQVMVVRGSARVFGLDATTPQSVNAGFFSTLEAGGPASPARPILRLEIRRIPGSSYEFESALTNDAFADVRVRRALDSGKLFPRPIFMLYVSHASEYLPDQPPENVTLQPFPVLPITDDERMHSGEQLLTPGSSYRFRFSVGTLLRTTPAVDHWMRLEYAGDLYGPAGEARVRVQSAYKKLDLRSQ